MNPSYYECLQKSVLQLFYRHFEVYEELIAFLNDMRAQDKKAVFANAAALSNDAFSRNAIRKWFYGQFQRYFQPNIKQFRGLISYQCRELMRQNCSDIYNQVLAMFGDLGLNKKQLYEIVRYELYKAPVIVAPVCSVKKSNKYQIYKEVDRYLEMWGYLAAQYIDEDLVEGGDL